MRYEVPVLVYSYTVQVRGTQYDVYKHGTYYLCTMYMYICTSYLYKVIRHIKDLHPHITGLLHTCHDGERGDAQLRSSSSPPLRWWCHLPITAGPGLIKCGWATKVCYGPSTCRTRAGAVYLVAGILLVIRTISPHLISKMKR